VSAMIALPPTAAAMFAPMRRATFMASPLMPGRV
jgi:hypothetical protein